ncbi:MULTISPECIES: hypothetical protein [unclassified Streptomyces]|uniref:hypothetical protein n=1 Tax=unclassified Streptomyces TaxID=2593676 RepID=UPI002E8208E0|nr:hypothetical protein [Streptomyces sp. NBC_00589]WTI39736.1 hypothetical protein OIC96_34575 [Streptomyces sp. NBC_00775]WUB26585.1 hypothetical protein OHA51_15155 [Streptomyces sp. NBC_00589]
MNGIDDDMDVLDALKGSLDDVTMAVPVERIVAGGRAVRRRRRRVAVAAVGVTAIAGLALGVPGIGHPSTAPPAGGAEPAAFTVAKRTDGTVAVTWTKEQYFKDPAGLQKALRDAGFPVLVKTGVFCKGPDDHTQVDEHGSGAGVDDVVKRERRDDDTVVFIYDPAAMPAHTQLFIGYLDKAQLAVTHGRPGSVERLVPTDVALKCGTDWRS